MFPNKPSIWLKHPLLPPNTDETASFVEYLRWMRTKVANDTENSGTILELFEEFEENDFSEALNRLTNRTRKLADFSFKVRCPWRIRVGGTKGPESMLLPAFDNLGMPYIPSSTLKGIAREMAIQDREVTEEQVKELFGDIDSDQTKMGEVIFLDAYPLPHEDDLQGGLNPDMANSIWKWEGDNFPEYNTNPNPCISLWKPKFVVGLRRTKKYDEEKFNQVKFWLIKGLDRGIGSRVNSGYGNLQVTGKLRKEVIEKKIIIKKNIVKVEFNLEGQLIHGRQTFAGWKENKNKTNWSSPGIAKDEVRPVAFRSMMRYWFRALAAGVLEPQFVRNLEMEIFGGIEPEPSTGLFLIEVTDNGRRKLTPELPGLMTGLLAIRPNYNFENLGSEKRKALVRLLKTLTWLMFHLGGVGQGARRPCHRRRAETPPWRGVDLEIIQNPKKINEFWQLPNSLEQLQETFRDRLKNFYKDLGIFYGSSINDKKFKTLEIKQNWVEAVDTNCEILVCQGLKQGNKNFALSILHHREFKIKRKNSESTKYDPQLCGRVDPSPSIPSPVWIRHLENDYQVVTVFGAKTGKRKKFLDKLKLHKEVYKNKYLPVFPLE